MNRSVTSRSLVLLFVLLAHTVLAMSAPSSGRSTEEPEAISLFGKPLYPMELAAEQRSALEGDLAKAQSDYDRDANGAGTIIWLGRRLAYLWRYREAVAVYTKGLELHPSTSRCANSTKRSRILRSSYGAAFDYIAAEADLFRWKEFWVPRRTRWPSRNRSPYGKEDSIKSPLSTR